MSALVSERLFRRSDGGAQPLRRRCVASSRASLVSDIRSRALRRGDFFHGKYCPGLVLGQSWTLIFRKFTQLPCVWPGLRACSRARGGAHPATMEPQGACSRARSRQPARHATRHARDPTSARAPRRLASHLPSWRAAGESTRSAQAHRAKPMLRSRLAWRDVASDRATSTTGARMMRTIPRWSVGGPPRRRAHSASLPLRCNRLVSLLLVLKKKK